MDRRQEVSKGPKDYLSQIEINAYNESQRLKYANKVLSVKTKIAETMYKYVCKGVKKGLAEKDIQKYIEKQRASDDYRIAFGLMTGKRDRVDRNLDLNALSGSEWE